ncbi:GlcG/HbpS family heme-binding protein [Marinobacter sp. F4218]|uniref:GlcG/HbpS family heme-binding protein n=1 Tax=Marinobacter sp. F4218 TaxID=2862868 RepID=UPI001C63150D|nr:heme-binding protein [Marinobacter sp. F4218]MBW7469793.1 heme-binding protein [Marinobacter sp. F4218]
MRTTLSKSLVFVSALALSGGAIAETDDQPVMIEIKRLSLDTALTIARTAIEACREQGVQVAVTVVDRGGHPQVVLRDVLAMDLALEVSYRKAYTAMTFTSNTSSLEDRFTGPFSVGKIDNVLLSAGGVPIQASGETVGGVGVSGAPSGEVDENCAQAGVAAVEMDLEMASF